MPDVLAVYAGQQGYAAVGLTFTVEGKLFFSDIDVDPLQHSIEPGVSQPVLQQQADQRSQQFFNCPG